MAKSDIRLDVVSTPYGYPTPPISDMDASRVTLYPSTKAYVRANGEIVRHVSNRRYVCKLRQYTDDECKAMAARRAAGEKLTVIATEYGMSYARARNILNRWHESHATGVTHAETSHETDEGANGSPPLSPITQIDTL
jgi:hypothetical protein